MSNLDSIYSRIQISNRHQSNSSAFIKSFGSQLTKFQWLIVEIELIADGAQRQMVFRRISKHFNPTIGEHLRAGNPYKLWRIATNCVMAELCRRGRKRLYFKELFAYTGRKLLNGFVRRFWSAAVPSFKKQLRNKLFRFRETVCSFQY